MSESAENRRLELPASDIELIQLAARIMQWLDKNGTFEVPQNCGVEGTHQGLPIVDDLIRHKFTATKEGVERSAPQAAARLGLDGPLEISHFPPHYQRDISGDLLFMPPSFQLDVSKKPAYKDGDRDDIFIINVKHLSGETSVIGSRHNDPSLPPEVSQEEFAVMDDDQKWTVYFQARETEQKLGLDLITVAQASDLMEIAGKLDEIKAFDDSQKP